MAEKTPELGARGNGLHPISATSFLTIGKSFKT